MPVRYELYENPPQNNDEKEKRFHVRLVSNGLVTTKKLIENMAYEASITEGDIINVLSSLKHQMVGLLSDGNKVHIEGLGYFQIGITSSEVNTGKRMKGEHVEFKTIHFQPEKDLKIQVKSKVKFLRAEKNVSHANHHSDEEIDAFLQEYFKTNSAISRKEFEYHLKFTKGVAIRRINKYIKEGKLKRQGLHGFPVYAKGDNF